MIGTRDYHLHTNASDGDYTPTELVKMAKEAGAVEIAITDHDTFDGVEEGLIAGKTYGLSVVPGIEISIEGKLKGLEGKLKFHLLAYFPDINCEEIKPLLKELERIRKDRIRRVKKAVKKLNNLANVQICYKDVKEEAKGESIGKPHIAAAIVKEGYAKDINEACKKYLNRGKAGYTKRKKMKPKRVIELVEDAGGIAVGAHFGKAELDGRPLTFKETKMALLELKSYGLRGVEVFYPDHDKYMTLFLYNIVKEQDMLGTVGSDYHGKTKKDIEILKGRDGNLIEMGEYIKNHESNNKVRYTGTMISSSFYNSLIDHSEVTRLAETKNFVQQRALI